RVDLRGDLDHHLIAAEVRLVARDRGRVRSGLWLAVLDEDDGSIGDREHIGAEGVVLLVRAAVALVEAVVLDPSPVHGEGLGSSDAAAVDGESEISVDIRLAARGGDEPTIALEGWLDHDGALAVDRDFGAVDLGAVEDRRAR